MWRTQQHADTGCQFDQKERKRNWKEERMRRKREIIPSGPIATRFMNKLHPIHIVLRQ